MMQILKIFFDRVVYPYRGFIAKKASRYFLEYHIVEILKDADNWFVIGKYQTPLDLLNRSAFRGIINEYVRSNKYSPTPKDIAVAISISVNACGKDNEGFHRSIINLAYHIVSSVQERISFDPVLKLTYESLGKDISKVETHQSRESIVDVFSSKKSLYMHYFNSFEDSRYSYPIKIWHQAEDKTWIEWEEKESIIVNVNPVRIREGFFLVGFDYHEVNSNNSLGVAVNVDGYEYFNRDRDENKAVWVR